MESPVIHRTHLIMMKRFFSVSRPSFMMCLTLGVLLLNGCAGYRLGTQRPAALEHVRCLRVNLFENRTLHPRVEVTATNAVIAALASDGTYQLTGIERADAVLNGVVTNLHYRQVRANRFDTMRAEEMEVTAEVEWVLTDAHQPLRVLKRGETRASTRFFIDSNQQTARQNALPDAMQRLGKAITARLADDF